jgi:hypothetical protein
METMKRIIITVAAVLMALGGASPALAQQTRVFQAELHHFSVPAGTCVDGVCDFESHGYGFTNLMGSVTVSAELTWDFNTTPCSTLDPIVFTLVGATGSITVSASGVVCNGPSPSGFPQFFIGEGEITSGTGAFSGISGSVLVEGTVTGIGPVVHMSGTVSY